MANLTEMKVSVLTLGCKVNQSESVMIEGCLRISGCSIVSLSETPDYCVINTCTVTSKSDYQSRQLIRRAARTGAKVIVTGCYAQLRAEDIKKMDGIYSIVPNSDKLSIIKMINGNIESNRCSFSVRSRPCVKVQDGCNNACSYCLVPLARGKSRSIDQSEIIEQVSDYSNSGYHEVVITGIHLGTYGYDLYPKKKLSYLIKTILNKTQISRIRLSSLEVNEIDDEIIELLQDSRLCRHIHIPLQSGDDTILKRMNRTYSSRGYINVIESILDKLPGIAIGTDVIVGFPGEGPFEFLNTKGILELLPFSYMHIFPFSVRPGTSASRMPMQVGSADRKQRFDELNALNLLKKAEYSSMQTNKTLDIIIEEHHQGSIMVGTSGNYLKVRVHSNSYPNKSLVSVRVEGIEDNVLRATPIELK
jgi:threonylcarbamoyladenosine tRNA methylthiotransferase MtaB